MKKAILSTVFLVCVLMSLSASAEDILKDGYGVRIVYADFDDGNASLSDINTDYVPSDTIVELLAAAETGFTDGKAYLSRTDFSHTCLRINFGEGELTNIAGKFITEYDVGVESGATSTSCTEFVNRIYYNTHTKSSDYWHNSSCASLISNAGSMVHEVVSWTAPSDATSVSYYDMRLKAKGKNYYDNAAVWFYPENSFMLSVKGSLSLVTATGDTYTLPETDGVKSYTTGTSSYLPGDTVNIADIEYCTLEAVYEKVVPVLKDGYGIQIFSADFDDSADFNGSIVAPSYINAEYTPSDAHIELLSVTSRGFYVGTAFLLRPDAHTCLRINFGENELTDISGKFITEYDVSVDAGASGTTCTDFVNRLYCDNETKYSDYRHNDTLTALINNAGSKIHEIIPWTVPDGAGTVTYYDLRLKNTEKTYYDNVTVWFYPEGSFILRSGDSLELITVSGTEYTFPETAGIASYICGEETYLPGESVALSSIEYKTVDVSDTMFLLDGGKITLSYEFENTRAGSADGTVKLDFGGQNEAFAKKVQLCWASGNDTTGFTVLDDYTVLLETDGASLVNGYTFDKALALPPEATALIARITDNFNSFDVVCKIPESKLYEGEPLYTMALISDVHVGWGASETNMKLMPQHGIVRDKINAMDDVEFIVIDGDFTQWYGKHSMASQWTLAEEYYKGYNKPIYFSKGNHEDPNYKSPYVASQGYDSFSYEYLDTFMKMWLDYSKSQGHYDVSYDTSAVDFYDTVINGQHFIFMAVPYAGYYKFGDEQLEWLEKKLFEAEESGKPIWIFGHIAANEKLNHTIISGKEISDAAYIEDFEAFEEILKRHPGAIYVSGDTHYNLDSKLVNTVNGEQILPSYVNDGAIIDTNMAYDEDDPNSGWSVMFGTNSMGLIAEVYEDRVLLRGRHFIKDKWLSNGLSEVTFRDKCTIEEISAVKTENSDGRYTLSVSDADESLNYTWFINGDETATGSSFTATLSQTDHIALRASDSNCSYRSEAYNGISDIPQKQAVISVDSDTVTVKNLTEEAMIIAAAYKGARLTFAKIINVTEDTSFKLSDYGFEYSETDTVKIFLVNKKLTPLAEAITK